jgi:hypothetical protein
MNTTLNTAVQANLKAALSYYGAMQDKDFDTMVSYLNDDICLISPLAEINGKEEVLTAAKNFGGMLKEIHIRSKFSYHDQVMLAYDMIVPEPIGKFRAAALMNFENNKITRIELFYDARAFEVKKGDIFSGAAS